MTKVYRLEFAHARHHGPFNPPRDDSFQAVLSEMSGFKYTLDPADAAQAVARAQDMPGPYDQPGIEHDGVTSTKIRKFFEANGDTDEQHYVFGFSSIEQYHQWVTTPLMRKALFKIVSKEVKSRKKWNDLELRCFDVPDKSVLVADHQVLFKMESATHSYQIPREEAIN